MNMNNDSRIIAVKNPHTKERYHYRFDFGNHAAGSEIRVRRVQEMERRVEAYKGQGCEVFIFPLDAWANGSRRWFYNYGGES